MKAAARVTARLAIVALVAATPLAISAADRPAPIALLSALDEEARPVLAAVTGRETVVLHGIPCTLATLDGRPVLVAATGVGKVNAAMVTSLVLDRFSPTAVIFSGVAGALDPELQPGDVVVAEALVQHDLVNYSEEGVLPRTVRGPRDGSPIPASLVCAPRLLALAHEAAVQVEQDLVAPEGSSRRAQVVFGTIATGDSFIGSRAKRTELRERFSARATEMEGAAVAQVCHEYGVPFLVVRGLSDRASGDAASEARRHFAVAARNAAIAALAVARRLGHGA